MSIYDFAIPNIDQLMEQESLSSLPIAASLPRSLYTEEDMIDEVSPVLVLAFLLSAELPYHMDADIETT
jgi:hypothetical protein